MPKKHPKTQEGAGGAVGLGQRFRTAVFNKKRLWLGVLEKPSFQENWAAGKSFNRVFQISKKYPPTP
jgi:hypothetical protein